ncbi:recombinase family protein [Nonomuraea angiospora]|uniref:recombinase family protein n=1 Tax=Nonomuraea angiospora TaxID=46172 RepID=UPI003322112C
MSNVDSTRSRRSAAGRVFADKKSGKTAERPEPAACRAFLAEATYTLVVPLLDRYGRSLAVLIAMVGEPHRLTPLHENVDATPGGRLIFHVSPHWPSSSASSSSPAPATATPLSLGVAVRSEPEKLDRQAARCLAGHAVQPHPRSTTTPPRAALPRNSGTDERLLAMPYLSAARLPRTVFVNG